ncbi:prefoldin subunit alpha [Candidatus Woesearchaeota archaeon]|nr:prefoldin subunit alpha [Candidatus Woesearchaeota archaeon]MCF8013741.1 prefoldin subunit alpha [Candidatus Woesearchaeota archaeon]
MEENNANEQMIQQYYEQYQQLANYMKQLEKAIIRIENSILGLKELEKANGDEEILAPIADGIFLEAKLVSNKNLKVNIGNNSVVEKSIPETIIMLEEQKKEIHTSLLDAESKIMQIEQMFKE